MGRGSTRSGFITCSTAGGGVSSGSIVGSSPGTGWLGCIGWNAGGIDGQKSHFRYVYGPIPSGDGISGPDCSTNIHMGQDRSEGSPRSRVTQLYGLSEDAQ